VDGNKIERNIKVYSLKTLFPSDNIDRIIKSKMGLTRHIIIMGNEK